MENNVFEPQRELAREFSTTYDNVDISGSVGYISNDSGSIPFVDCRGYNLIVLKVYSITSGAGFQIWGSPSPRSPQAIDFVFSKKGNIVSRVDEAGTYLVDVSKLNKIAFYRDEVIASGTITFDILRCVETFDTMPKVVQLGTSIVNITGNNNIMVFPVGHIIDISNYRFLSFRVKTIPLDGESIYKAGSVNLSTEFICKGAKYDSYTSCGVTSAFVMQNNYISTSEEWKPIVAPFVRLWIKSLASTAPTPEAPEKYEVTLFGIR